MYRPSYTRWDDRAGALDLARRYNFGELITVADGAPLITHMPFLIDESRNVLRGHFARANPHAAHVEGAHIVVFKGPCAYISPDWYAASDSDVPTWNYLAVHVSGKGRALTQERETDAFLADLSAHEEARRPDLDRGGKIWTMDKVAAKEHARMRAAIVALEIDIEKVEAKANSIRTSRRTPSPALSRRSQSQAPR